MQTGNTLISSERIAQLFGPCPSCSASFYQAGEGGIYQAPLIIQVECLTCSCSYVASIEKVALGFCVQMIPSDLRTPAEVDRFIDGDVVVVEDVLEIHSIMRDGVLFDRLSTEK